MRIAVVSDEISDDFFQALARDGYQGTITLGAQLEPRVLSTMQSVEALWRLLDGVWCPR
jgi:hypothetical protein